MALKIIALIGIVLSIYAYYVESKIGNKNYKAMCDINKEISCSRVLDSKYGKLFGISNSLLGILFYLFVLMLFYFRPDLIVYFALISVLGSFYLGYLQFFKVKSFCLVCSAIYVVNILLLVFSL